jgi:hypothetical protein
VLPSMTAEVSAAASGELVNVAQQGQGGL